MSDCIFCKIINGEIPSKKVLENDKFYAFYDIEPVKKVHVLIVPKNHVANIAHITEKTMLKVYYHLFVMWQKNLVFPRMAID